MNDESAAFKVEFCPDMTVSYLDQDGLLKFVFEIAPESRPKTVTLYGGAVDAALKDIPTSTATQARMGRAFKRVVAYLESCGYEVDVIE